jgi:hypothetical protein
MVISVYITPVMYSDISGYAPDWLNAIGNWFEEHWVQIAIGTAFIVVGALVTGLTCGVGTTFWAAFGSAMMTSAVQVAASMAVSVAVNGLVNISLGNTFFTDVGDSLARGFMWGGIFSGGSQIISGGFRFLRSTFGYKGINSDMFGLLSPDKLHFDQAGSTLLRIGTRKGLRLAIDTGRYALQMHIVGSAHIWLIPELVGIIEYYYDN